MMRNRKIIAGLVAGALLLSMIMANPIPVAGADSLVASSTVAYPFYPDMSTKLYTINGDQGFSLNPSKTAQPSGTITSAVTSTNENLIKCFYYGYGGAGNLFAGLPETTQLVYTHLLGSYVYSGDLAGFSFYTLQRYFDCDLAQYYNQLSTLRNPNSHTLSFTNTNMDFTLSNDILVSKTIGLSADPNSSGSFDLPQGLTLVNETRNTVATGGKVYVHAGDRFRFEAASNFALNELDLDFTLDRDLYDYAINLAKVKGTVNPGNPANDGYQTIGTLTKTSQVLTAKLHLQFRPNGNALITAQSDLRQPVADKLIKINGPYNYAGEFKTDGSGEIHLNNIAPGEYFIEANAVDFPYVLETGLSSFTVKSQETQEVTVSYREFDEVVVRYIASNENLVLKEEIAPVGSDWHTVAFAEFELVGYRAVNLAIFQDHRLAYQTSDPVKIIEGFVIKASEFGELVTFKDGQFVIEIDYELKRDAPVVPQLTGHDGTLLLSQTMTGDLDRLIRECTAIEGTNGGESITAMIEVGPYQAKSFYHAGIVAVAFEYQNSANVKGVAHYNITVVDDLSEPLEYQISYVDINSLKYLDYNGSSFGQGSYARKLLEKSLESTKPVVSYNLSNNQKKQLKGQYQNHIDIGPSYLVDSCEIVRPQIPNWDLVDFYQEEMSGPQGGLEQFYLEDNEGVLVDQAQAAWKIDPAGRYLIEVAAPGKYLGSRTIYLESVDLNREDIEIAPLPQQEYSGASITPSMTISLGDTELIENRDYRLRYQSNIIPGTGQVVVSGIGNYHGNYTINFEIQ